MNSHRFIEEENKLLKERIRVLEEAVKHALNYCHENNPTMSFGRSVVDKLKEALTPQPKE